VQSITQTRRLRLTLVI